MCIFTREMTLLATLFERFRAYHRILPLFLSAARVDFLTFLVSRKPPSSLFFFRKFERRCASFNFFFSVFRAGAAERPRERKRETIFREREREREAENAEKSSGSQSIEAATRHPQTDIAREKKIRTRNQTTRARATLQKTRAHL